ncbi:hypothetical protein GCM10009038_17370 [Salinicola rhizosphaerae]|uniref:IS3 family transposase n=1 Tax=Salinicola rhizosphaerae TaxID=1443141 RepID=A0ABQ3DZY7_9GAMM|nr:hypothetical protein GCM10009038_17370 [Salinicola rhizosphaerae]
MARQRRSFSTEFKREAARLVLEQGYSVAQAARAVDVGVTPLRRWIDQLRAERGGVTPKSKALTPEQQRIQELESRINRLEREKAILKKATALLKLRATVSELFNQSRRSAGSRTIMLQMRESGLDVGRFKIRRLMQEMGLTCQQPRPPAYRRAPVERPGIPNRLNRQFTVDVPNRMRCGDITYVWAQNRWHYLAVVLDLYARRVVGWAMSGRPDAALVIKALDRAFEQRGRPAGAAVSFGSRWPVCEPGLPAAAVALSDTAEHEPSR